MSSALLRRLGLFGLGLLTFVIATIALLPSSLLSRILEAQAEAQLGFSYDVNIERTSFVLPFALRGEDVTIGPMHLDPENPQRPLRLDVIRASVNPFTLAAAVAGGVPSATLDARLNDGRIRVTTADPEDGAIAITAAIYDFPLTEVPQLAHALGVPMTAVANGTVSLIYNDERRLSTGEIDLSLNGVTFGPGLVMKGKIDQLPEGVPMPVFDMGTMRLEARIDGNDFRIGEFTSEGSDIRMSATGSIDLRNPLSESNVEIPLNFEIDSGFVEEAGLGPILADSQMVRAQVGSGYAMTLRGRVTNLSMRPGVAGSARPR
ncbi:MAG: type II secretion system protein N [Bradymonadia bacterium]|jgi:type II secretion system protein N